MEPLGIHGVFVEASANTYNPLHNGDDEGAHSVPESSGVSDTGGAGQGAIRSEARTAVAAASAPDESDTERAAERYM